MFKYSAPKPSSTSLLPDRPRQQAQRRINSSSGNSANDSDPYSNDSFNGTPGSYRRSSSNSSNNSSNNNSNNKKSNRAPPSYRPSNRPSNRSTNQSNRPNSSNQSNHHHHSQLTTDPDLDLDYSKFDSSIPDSLMSYFPTSSDNVSAMEDTAKQHFIIGDNLRHKAFYDDSIEEFQKALHIQEPLLGEYSPVVAKSFYSLGLALRATKEYSQGLYYLNKAASIYQHHQKVQKEKKRAANNNQKDNDDDDANDGAEANGEESKTSPSSSEEPTIFEQELLDCKLNMARTHHSNGVDLQRNGEYDKSILEHRKALSIREYLLGKSHLETARTYYVMGCALSDRGDFDEALAELRRALRTRMIIFGKEHLDTMEVIDNMGTVLLAKGNLTSEEITNYKSVVVQSLLLENEGDVLCRQSNYDQGMLCYRKALSLEEQVLGDLHPTTCDLYLRMADALGMLGDLEASLAEYKSAISIYERLMGKFHVKVAQIYNKLAGILMDKGEYETALSFYAKAYGIYDSTLGNHEDTKQAIMNLRLAAAKERTAKESMDLIKKAEEEFKSRKQLLSFEGGDNDVMKIEKDPEPPVVPTPEPETGDLLDII